jgi:hypothetical protein
MKKFLPKFAAIFLLFLYGAHAEEGGRYPNLSGSTLFQFNADRVISTQKNGVSPNNTFVYIESDFGLNFNQNWSVRTNWRLQPNSVLTTRDSTNPERYRTFLSSDRGIHLDDAGLLVEELKVQFQNEDMRFVAGKFDPNFGTAHNKAKRIGVFTSQFTEDYNLREKIGVSFSALLENSKVTVNSFFNDTTGLSGSAINNRKTASSKNGAAGSTNALASYSVAIDGKDLFEIENLTYNLGFRSLSVDRFDGRQREKGYVVGSEYLHKMGNTSIIPFVELVKLTSFTGEQGRDATYGTAALISKYSSWTASVSYLMRTIKSHRADEGIKKSDQVQLSIGYKFTNNLTLDFSRSNMKEDGYKGSMIGVVASYLYKF